MEVVREWIITIVSVIIFVTFVEILIPNSNNKRYINVVVGLLIMIIILRPLIGVLRGDVDLSERILLTSSQIDYTTTKNRVDHYYDMQNETIIQLYKSQLSEQMKYRIEGLTNMKVVDITLFIEEEDADNLGFINNVEITLKKENDSNKIEEKIEPIKIDVSLNKNDNTVETQSIWINNEKEMIKQDFRNHFNLSKDNVIIHILQDK